MSVWIDLREGTELTLRGFNADMPDQTIVVESRVNRGGSATIYTGRFTQSKHNDPSILALKVFSRVPSREGDILLRRELEAARILRHPHIIPFLGACTFESHTVLVSHFMKNGNLGDYVRDSPNADRDNLVLQVAQAVAFLHNEAKIVHGDLKCENVLVSDSGDSLLADFGLSTSIEKPEAETTTMTAIRILNTVQFCAPEVLDVADVSAGSLATRVRSKTRESDIYAFGMLLLQAYTGQVPWIGLTPIEIVSRVGRRQIPSQPPLVLLSTFLWDVCKTCWGFNPTSRPKIQEIVSVLELVKSGNTFTNRSLLLSNEFIRDNFFEMAPALQAVLAAHESENLMTRVQAHLVLSPAQVLSDDDLRVLRNLLSTELGVEALKSAAGAEQTIMAAMEPYYTDKSAIDAFNTVADAALAVLDLEAAEENKDVYYPTAQLVPVIARARRRDPKLSEKLEELFAPAQVRRPSKHSDDVTCVAYMPDGDQIVTGSYDCAVRVWDVKSGQIVGAPLIGHAKMVSSVAVSADGTKIASGSADKTIRIWEVGTGASIAALEGHSSSVYSVAFSPDGKRIASGSHDETFRVWDVASRRTIVGPVDAYSSYISSVAYSPDGTRIALGAHDGVVCVWNVETGTKVWQAEISSESEVYSVAYSPNGEHIVAGCWDGSVLVLDADTGETVLGPLTTHTDMVGSVAFSPRGDTIASASRDQTIRLWDAKTGEELDVLRGHRNDVRTVAFSPDGKHVASGSNDLTMRIWDATRQWKSW